MPYMIPYTRCTSTYTCAVPMSMLPWFHDSLIPWFHYSINATLRKKMCSRFNLVLLVLIFLVRKLWFSETFSTGQWKKLFPQDNERNPQCLSLLHRLCSAATKQEEPTMPVTFTQAVQWNSLSGWKGWKCHHFTWQFPFHHMRPSAFPMLWVPAFPPTPTFLSSADNALEWAKEGRQ